MKNQTAHKVTKVRRSAKQWQHIMASFDASGLSQEAYCTQESIAASTFSKWRKRLMGGATKDKDDPMFVELTPLAGRDKRSEWDIELSLGTEVVLRIRQPA